MGAKVQCNNSLQFFDSNKDVWEDVKTKKNFGDAWPDYGTGMMLRTNQSCSIFKQDTMEKCSEYDKESLKQTMLKHEKIFRSQVRELHRLYEVQKSLMDDLRRKDFSSSAFSPTRRSGELLFHFGPEQQTSKDKRNLWDFLDGSVREKDNRGRSHPTLGTDNMQTPGSGLVDHNTLIVLNSKENNGGFKDFNRLQPIRATPRRFDLEQPADEYVDDEAVDELREDPLLKREIHGNGKESNFFKFQSDVEPESDLQLTLSTGWEKSKKKDDRPNGTLLDMGFHNKEREEAKEAKHSRFNEDSTLFSAASSRADAHVQEDLEKKRSVLPSQRYFGAPWGLGQDYQRHEDHRAEWKKFSIEPEKRKENSQSLDIEAGERSTQENPKEPHWIFQGQGSSTAIL
ncbi:uncharacterized protein LOC131064910 isoform X1 [Cryptomeria japonica]|uniref:uncharacterized protein LOC131064910 isoform X1 n=1 Tax=Cryptomeria japonica TaxID=3369 RepID=UPI0027DAB442|nr:uncharacterized protein LOC131064910 isoform X1 [Cryptomeria japonica]